MKTLKECLEDIFEPLYEMANISSKDTGLSNQNIMIYISTKQGSHGPRVKVFLKCQPSKSVSFSIAKEPVILTDNILNLKQKEISEIKYWISINNVELLKFWKSDYKNVEIFDVLRNLDKI